RAAGWRGDIKKDAVQQKGRTARGRAARPSECFAHRRLGGDERETAPTLTSSAPLLDRKRGWKLRLPVRQTEQALHYSQTEPSNLKAGLRVACCDYYEGPISRR